MCQTDCRNWSSNPCNEHSLRRWWSWSRSSCGCQQCIQQSQQRGCTQKQHNICPALAVIATNPYRKASSLFVDQQTIHSKEGTTQGDPLAMAIYAIVICPLIDNVQNDVMQIWYGDDVTASGKLSNLKECGTSSRCQAQTLATSPCTEECGCHKTIASRGSHQNLCRMQDDDHNRGNQVPRNTNWRWSLCEQIHWAEDSRVGWRNQAAFLHCTKWATSSVCHIHAVLLVSGCSSVTEAQLTPLEEAIKFIFIPGRSAFTDKERSLLSLPARLGGLGLTDPRMLREEIKRSREATQSLIEHLIKKDPTYSSEMKANQLQARKELKVKKRKVIEEEADLLAQALDEQQKRAMILSQEKGASHWLTILPMVEHEFSLHFGTDCASDTSGSWKGCLQLVHVEAVQCWECPQLQPWRLSDPKVQWAKEHHSQHAITGVPQRVCWTSPTTPQWRRSDTCLSRQRRKR